MILVRAANKMRAMVTCQNQYYLWIEIESLQRVNNQGILRQPVVHDHVKAVQERRGLDNRLVVGIVQTLVSKRTLHTEDYRKKKGSRRLLKITPAPQLRRSWNELHELSRLSRLAAHLAAHSRGRQDKYSVFI